MLYLLKWFFGDVDVLWGVAQGWVDEVPLDNHGVIAGRMQSGPLFSMEFSSVTEYPRGERVEIYGSRGTLVIDQVLDPPAVLYRGADDPHGMPLENVPYDLDGWKPESIRATAVDFVAAVRDGRAPSVTAEDSRYVVSLVERAYESATSAGARVSALPT
jgi:predicted dehydrogenase